MIRVYLAGPYSRPDPCINTKAMLDVADRLLALGFVPYVPLLSHFWHTVSPKPYDQWLALSMAWLPCCDCVLRLPGESPGADREVAEAERIGKPVLYSEDELIRRGRGDWIWP